ncbi:MAG TPA: UDP-N-acetylglucosamine 2-epimerase (non-hydrolyzing) [Longimicrobiales bacterium]|nr:UDP-N-acetylglucosamine 2-epimerase (non-hydrolyzing) [Longimicrobiales bacterium]
MPESAARVLVIVGTRPEGIKLAPVVEALRGRGDGIDARVALTGQHTTLIDQVLDVFALEASWDLGIMKEGQDLYDVAHGCLDGLRAVVREFRPDMLLVQGDTATVFFGALVGFFERIRVGHVEAGLRSGDKWRPYPEEILRRMTGVAADLHFAPTGRARDNLLAENVDPAAIHLTGNTVVDAVQRIAALPHEPENAALRDVLESGRRMLLVTAHRRESFGAPLREAFAALREIADTYDDVTILYPVHPNPNVRGPAEELLGAHPRIRLTAPLDYLDLVHALRHAALVITDSGGIQEEAPSFGTPVLVLREVTERPEAVEAGVARLVGTDRGRIVRAAADVLRGSTRAAISSPYGDGRAGERVADIVMHTLTGAPRTTEDWRP